MLVEISKIKVGERIRKDFGDIQELADDIKENSLLNPIVVTPDGDGYLLIAGERRLKACQLLGYAAITVTTVGVRDAEQALAMEISENECRKEFTKTERLSYARRLAAIESVKARARMHHDPTQDFAEAEKGESREIVARKLGFGNRETYRQEQAIADNAEVFTVEEFKDWDEGRLSTNKAFRMMKERLERQVQEAEMRFKVEHERRIEAESKPGKEVIREVVPEDYREVKSKARSYDADMRQKNDEIRRVCNERNALQDRVKELERTTQRGLGEKKLSESVYYFCNVANDFVREVGGLVWLTEHINEMPERERELFLKAARAFRDFGNVFAQNLERGLKNGN